MATYKIEQPTEALIARLAQNMNALDQAEVQALGFESPLAALETSVRTSRDVVTLTASDEPVAMAGVSDWGSISTTGLPWVLTSRDVKQHAVPFLKSSKILANHWLREYNRLCQFIDERNVDAMRWVEWVGFERRGVQFLGPERLPFMTYEMRA